MSLGALGEYGSDSSISDSEAEDQGDDIAKASGNPDDSVKCVDPLCLEGVGSDDSSSSSDDDSLSSDSTRNSAPPLPSLPLPDIDDIVARNPSYSNSELQSSASVAKEEPVYPAADAGMESSVFTNPFEQSEAAKLAILKKHVSEFDKKPATRGPSPPPRSNQQHRKKRKVFQVHPVDDKAPDSLFDDNDSSLGSKKERKHRCGVTDTLQPPKKYMKMYDRVYK